MKFVFYTNSISPHQLPLARELARRFGVDQYLYLYTMEQTPERLRLGWGSKEEDIHVEKLGETNRHWLEDAAVLMSGLRDFDLFEHRVAAGRLTIYSAERWFKPIHVLRFGQIDCSLPGWLRLFCPRYFRMARRLAYLLKCDVAFWCLPMGVWAERDVRLICRLFGHGHLDRLRVWGYFVEPSAWVGHALPAERPQGVVRLLWVGRLLGLKRVDDIVRAVHVHDCLKRVDDSLPKITLDIYGSGVEELRLRRMVSKFELDDLIKFHPPVPIAEVRMLMHEHDVYVLSSNACEGWGAVVNEALEEGMKVVGTYEAGASATLLPNSNLYHSGDWRRLRELLVADIVPVGIGKWSVKEAANRLMNILERA